MAPDSLTPGGTATISRIGRLGYAWAQTGAAAAANSSSMLNRNSILTGPSSAGIVNQPAGWRAVR